jgi:hypothetical protein
MYVFAELMPVPAMFFSIALIAISPIFDSVMLFNSRGIHAASGLLIEPVQPGLLVDPIQFVSLLW